MYAPRGIVPCMPLEASDRHNKEYHVPHTDDIIKALDNTQIAAAEISQNLYYSQSDLEIYLSDKVFTSPSGNQSFGKNIHKHNLHCL